MDLPIRLKRVAIELQTNNCALQSTFVLALILLSWRRVIDKPFSTLKSDTSISKAVYPLSRYFFNVRRSGINDATVGHDHRKTVS